MAKVNIYIPNDLLEQVDAEAGAMFRSRSSVVQEAVAEYLTSARKIQREILRRASVREAISIADEAAAHAAEHDDIPDISASEFLRGLRDADDDATDEEIVAMIRARRSKAESQDG